MGMWGEREKGKGERGNLEGIFDRVLDEIMNGIQENFLPSSNG
jgi:hypothetical protein